MKPACEPASSRPEALCILEKAPRIFPVRRSFWTSKEEKRLWSDISFSLRNLPVRAFDSRTQGLSTPLARRRSSCPPPLPNLVCTHLIERYKALRDSVPCLSRAATPPEGHQIGARNRRAPGNTILSQPYRRRVSTDRLNREGCSQLAASFEGEPSPTPAGKTLPPSYPETRFRREREGTRICDTDRIGCSPRGYFGNHAFLKYCRLITVLVITIISLLLVL